MKTNVINPLRKTVLNNHLKQFNNTFSKTQLGKINQIRNTFGVPFHSAAIGSMLYGYSNIVSEIYDFYFLSWAFITKLNCDFMLYTRNINIRKAAALSNYLRRNGIENPEEIRYAVKKFFTSNLMPLYPLLHQKGMKKIVEKGEYTRSLETATGLMCERTDKKGIIARIIQNKRAKLK